ncbi:MAG TPA: selenium cofactor biosynthesis protein YqeC [Anaerolineae bacterium]
MKAEVYPLPSAFNLLPSGELIAFVGGGGKTSLMFALAGALTARGQRVVTTTTTRIFAAQMKLAPAVLTTEDTEGTETERLDQPLAQFGSCLVVGRVEGEKALGVPADLPARLLARPDVDHVLVEADGSQMRPIKAPADHEPVIPPETTLLVPVVGIDALDGPIREVAHRPELVMRLLNSQQLTVNPSMPQDQQLTVGSGQYEVTERLSVGAVACLLTHPEGGLKNAPDGTRVIPLINKVETATQLVAARQIAGHALHAARIAQVVIGAVKSEQPVHEVHRRVTAVVLAAGESRRMGKQTKQLLPWGETTVLGQTLHNLKQTMIHDILVVSGHEAKAVEAIATAENVDAIRNTQYASGEMLSSLQTAIRHLPPNRAAVLVVLADQPMVEPETMERLLEAYWQGQGELIAPIHDGRRGNPVLIGRAYFDELLALPPGAAPRDVLKKHRDELCLVSVESDSVLRDLDRPEEYERWRPS